MAYQGLDLTLNKKQQSTSKKTHPTQTMTPHIVCLPDLFLPTRAASEGFFAFVREPIRQGCGMDPGFPPTAKKPSGLLPDFDLRKFRALAGWDAMHSTEFWRHTWHTAPTVAVNYLFAHVPRASLVLSYDMPPWLAQACRERDINWLDIRPSPLAFGRDLYFALRASDTTLQERLTALCVTDNELRLEASMLAANQHAHRLDLEECNRYVYNLDACLLFVGQHPQDAALLSPMNQAFLSCADFSEELRELARGKKVLHMLDTRNIPQSALLEVGYLGGFEGLAKLERDALAAILGVPVKRCLQNIYQVLSSHDDVELAGISAPALQEAAWFEKTAHTLFRPHTPLENAHGLPEESYVQIRFQDLLTPAFWHTTLAPDAPPPKPSALPELERNLARTALNNWGDYEKVTTWERPLHHASFERSGGVLLRQRIEKLEHISSTAQSITATDDTTVMRKKICALKDSKKGLTAYILGNGPSLNELDVEALLKEESFWCNQAYELVQIRQGLNFIPKYYFVCDPMVFDKYQDEIMAVNAGMKFFSSNVYKKAYIHHLHEIIRQDVIIYPVPKELAMDEGHFSNDPSQAIFSGCTVVLDAIQFAFYMGYDKVLVGGVDLDYSGTPYFFGGQTPDYHPIDSYTRRIRQAFHIAEQYFNNHGRILAKMTKSPNLPLKFIDKALPNSSTSKMHK